MRGDVDHRDRHERVDEGPPQLARRRCRRRPSARRRSRAGRSAPTTATPSSRPSVATTFGAVSSPTIPSSASASSTETSLQSWPWLNPSNVTVPIITDDEQHRARHRIQPRQPAQRRPQADDAVARLPHRHAREEVEVDGEGLAVAGPRLRPEERLHRERVDGVDDRGGGQVARHLAPAGDQLDPGERQQRERGGIAAPALGVRPDARQLDRAPRAERAEHVAEQHAGEHQADPEVDQDERRGEVVERRAAARVAGVDHDREQRAADRGAERPPRPGCRACARARRAAAARAAPAAAGRGQSTARPDERDHEHDRGGPARTALRDRQASCAARSRARARPAAPARATAAAAPPARTASRERRVTARS